MTEASHEPSVPAATTAGALLKAARERQGVHIAVLAAAIKISPRKLDALEGDRYSELPDATFTRALAQTVCRALKIDSQPVLALLPQALPATLDAVGEGLNTPFRERFPSGALSALVPRAPLVWAAAALLGAAALVYFWPGTPGGTRKDTSPVTSAARSLPSAEAPRVEAAAPPAPPVAAAPAVTPPVSSASAVTAGAADAPATPRPTDVAPVSMVPSSTGAVIVVSEPVWLEVIDSKGEVVFQRTIQPGESPTFDQAPPLKLKIGNATAAKLSFRGEPVDLVPLTRSSVARVVLK